MANHWIKKQDNQLRQQNKLTDKNLWVATISYQWFPHIFGENLKNLLYQLTDRVIDYWKTKPAGQFLNVITCRDDCVKRIMERHAFKFKKDGNAKAFNFYSTIIMAIVREHMNTPEHQELRRRYQKRIKELYEQPLD